jgi:hypothetical protein
MSNAINPKHPMVQALDGTREDSKEVSRNRQKEAHPILRRVTPWHYFQRGRYRSASHRLT